MTEVLRLKRRILELESQLPHRYEMADTALGKCGTDMNMAGGVLLQLSTLGGKELINPVMIKDGLSDGTIKCIREDLLRSYNLTVMYKPKERKD